MSIKIKDFDIQSYCVDVIDIFTHLCRNHVQSERVV